MTELNLVNRSQASSPAARAQLPRVTVTRDKVRMRAGMGAGSCSALGGPGMSPQGDEPYRLRSTHPVPEGMNSAAGAPVFARVTASPSGFSRITRNVLSYTDCQYAGQRSHQLRAGAFAAACRVEFTSALVIGHQGEHGNDH